MSDIPSLFHAYDIRGTTADGLDPAFAERLGRVLAEIYTPKRILVCRDMRTTSPALEEALVKGLNEQGVDTIRIGLCTTPLFNISMGLEKGTYDFGVMVTASHNPAQYNGFKMTDANIMPIGLGSGMEAIRDRFLSDAPFATSKKKGTSSEDPRALQMYLDKIFSHIDISNVPKMKIAIDAGNGMAGFVLPELMKRIPSVEALPLYWELDGTFPNHEANPQKPETLVKLSETVRAEGCDFGAAYDGDCDRIGFVDENGEQIPGDILIAIFARALLRDHPGELIFGELRCSWSVQEEIKNAGGRFEMTRVGNPYIKEKMREEGALFGGELSKHFFYRDFWCMESGDYTLLLMLRELAVTGKKLSELWKPIKRYANSGEINTVVSNPDEILARVRSVYTTTATRVSDIDGVFMEFGVDKDGSKRKDAWWFSARKSNTEPLIRLILEAVDQKVMEQKRDELVKMIQG